VIIEALRGRRRVIERLLAVESAGTPTYCCAVAWAEIYAGVRGGEEAATESFFRARGEVTLDAETGRRAGSYLSRYARSHALEIADALVAAAASTAGLLLWTLNRRDYPMPDVRFYEPV
jgi:predicted nucleic acid-binding protein